MALRLARRLHLTRRISLLESRLVDVPTVVGWIKPVVLLPVSALAGLSAEQLEAILAHELAHIRRHDYLVNLLQTLVETLLFYHPAVWWLSGRIRAERENCCDDLAVSLCGDPVTYASALADLEALPARTLARHGRQRRIAPAADSPVARRADVSRRARARVARGYRGSAGDRGPRGGLRRVRETAAGPGPAGPTLPAPARLHRRHAPRHRPAATTA